MLSAIAFASGFAALVFEALWFRVAGLTFGNGIWASSIVLSAFMAGLALGNGLAARLADRLRDPIRFYAFLELAIGVTGVALVALLPVVLGVVYATAVRHEEAYLEGKFGDAYRAYRRSVRRWL